MDDTTAYYAKVVHRWVWSGQYSAEAIADMLAEQLEDDEAAAGLDEAAMQALASQELAAKQQAEATWPALTDCDRLDQAFAALTARGLVALHHAGYEMSDGLSEVSEVVAAAGETTMPHQAASRGYCFYHGQDVEGAVAGLGLWLAYGSLGGAAASQVLVGQQVRAAMQEVGLVVEWNGNPESRIKLKPFNWQRRYRQAV